MTFSFLFFFFTVSTRSLFIQTSIGKISNDKLRFSIHSQSFTVAKIKTKSNWSKSLTWFFLFSFFENVTRAGWNLDSGPCATGASPIARLRGNSCARADLLFWKPSTAGKKEAQNARGDELSLRGGAGTRRNSLKLCVHWLGSRKGQNIKHAHRRSYNMFPLFLVSLHLFLSLIPWTRKKKRKGRGRERENELDSSVLLEETQSQAGELSWWTLSTTRPIWRRDRPEGEREREREREREERSTKERRRWTLKVKTNREGGGAIGGEGGRAASTLEKRSFTVVDATMIRGARHSPLLLFLLPLEPLWASLLLHFRCWTCVPGRVARCPDGLNVRTGNGKLGWTRKRASSSSGSPWSRWIADFCGLRVKRIQWRRISIYIMFLYEVWNV